jgi:D-alanine-D-alanine ligase
MADDKTRVLVLYGGRSAEHEISIISARFIVDSLDRERFEPVLVGIDKEGRWTLQREEQLPTSGDPRDVRVGDGPAAFIRPMPTEGDAAGRLDVEGQDAIEFDVVFPVLHGPLGEDGCMQGLLELAAVPYVGAGVTGCAVGMDKVLQKQIFEHNELPVVPYRAFTRAQWKATRSECLESCVELGELTFVKPANMGSSLGIRKSSSADELPAAIEHAFIFDTKVLVEKGLDAVREIELSVLGNDEPRASLPGEIVVHHHDGFYSYEAKYIDEGADLRVPAELYHAEVGALQLLALRAFRAIDCAGMARVDMFLTEDRDVFINEVNTIPGFTAISMYPRLWKASGVEPTALVSELLELAIERHGARRALRTSR